MLVKVFLLLMSSQRHADKQEIRVGSYSDLHCMGMGP